jgi:hypothetical protein
MSVEEFVKLFNAERKANSGTWFDLTGNVCGAYVMLRAYGTWIERKNYENIYI